jgi:poly(glycerol-phosphate) alpha-glucosyltransferase
MLDPWAVQNSAWKKRLVGALFENRHLANATCLHALCEPEAQAIGAYGLKNPVCIIPNGIDLPDITKDLDPPWGAKFAEKKILLFLGRIHPKKGLPALLAAWHQLRQAGYSGAEWTLAIAGWDQDGHEDTLKQFVDVNSLQDSVIFLGPLFGEFKQAALNHADAFILPSYSEGLPMTVLEAWANKLPVLMTPQCNLPEGFASGAALNIQTKTEEIMVGLESLFSMSDTTREKMGESGFELVQSKFTWEKVAEQFYAVYSWMLGGGNPPSCVHLR